MEIATVTQHVDQIYIDCLSAKKNTFNGVVIIDGMSYSIAVTVLSGLTMHTADVLLKLDGGDWAYFDARSLRESGAAPTIVLAACTAMCDGIELMMFG